MHSHLTGKPHVWRSTKSLVQSRWLMLLPKSCSRLLSFLLFGFLTCFAPEGSFRCPSASCLFKKKASSSLSGSPKISKLSTLGIQKYKSPILRHSLSTRVRSIFARKWQKVKWVYVKKLKSPAYVIRNPWELTLARLKRNQAFILSLGLSVVTSSLCYSFHKHSLH